MVGAPRASFTSVWAVRKAAYLDGMRQSWGHAKNSGMKEITKNISSDINHKFPDRFSITFLDPPGVHPRSCNR